MTNEFKVGLFSFVSLLGLALMIVLIKNMSFKEGQDYIIRFDSIKNLSVDGYVQVYGGIRVGQITGLSFNLEKAHVYITITDSLVNTWILEGKKIQFSIDSSSFFSKKNILLSFHGPAAKPIQIISNSASQINKIPIIDGFSPRGFDSIITQTENITNKIDKLLLSEILLILKQIRQYLDTPHLNNILNNLDQTSQDLKHLFQKSLPKTLTQTRSAIKTTEKDLSILLKSLNQFLLKTSNQLHLKNGFFDQSNQLLKNVSKLIQTTNKVIQKLEDKNSPIGALIMDENMAKDIKEIISNLNQTTKSLKNNPLISHTKPKKPF